MSWFTLRSRMMRKSALSRGRTWRFGVVSALTALLVLGVAWAQERRSYDVNGQRHDCANRGPYDDYVKNLKGDRDKLKKERDDLPGKIKTANQNVQTARAALNKASGTDADTRSNDLVVATKTRKDLLDRKNTVKTDIKKKDEDIGRATGNFMDACKCGPGPVPQPGTTGGGQCR